MYVLQLQYAVLQHAGLCDAVGDVYSSGTPASIAVSN
jgi:hypothetical protein